MTDKSKLRVAICIPSGDLVHADFMMSLINLIVYTRSQGINVAALNTKCSHIDMSRFQMVEAARSVEATHLFFIDSDMIVPADTIVRLLAHGDDIVGAGYVRRREPHNLVSTELDGSVSQIKASDTGKREMKRMPTGCLMIGMDVFNKVPEPWFDSRWNDAKRQRVTEDNAFCDDARRCGYQIFMDVDITKQVGHIGQTIFYTQIEEETNE